MSSPLPLRAAVATLDDEAWEDLLNLIEERRVIPIIGPELISIRGAVRASPFGSTHAAPYSAFRSPG